MRDVRGVFAAFAALAGAAVVALAALYVVARRGGHPERWWSAVRAGAIGLVGAIVVGGVITIFAFDAAFEVFHRLFFPSGSYLVRPGDRPPRPALPVRVLVRDDDGPRGGHRRAGGDRDRDRRARGGRAAHAPAARPRRRGQTRIGDGRVSGVPIARILGIEVRLHLSWIFIIVIITATVGGRLTSLQPVRRRDAVVGDRDRGVAALHAHGRSPTSWPTRWSPGGRAWRSTRSRSTSSARPRSSTSAPRRPARGGDRLAGPLTSLAIGVAAVVLALVGVVSGVEALQVVGDVLVIVGALDLVLAGVSLVPAFPLDGGRLVRAIGWARSGDPRRGALAGGPGRARRRLAARWRPGSA